MNVRFVTEIFLALSFRGHARAITIHERHVRSPAAQPDFCRLAYPLMAARIAFFSTDSDVE
jgi:hypothetical protein